MRLFVISWPMLKKDLMDLTSLKINKKEKREEEFQSNDTVYQPVKKNEEFIDCYFTDSVHKAYRATISRGKIKR